MSNHSFEPNLQRVSLLADGQLQGEDFGRTVVQLAQSPEARQAWDSYHLIGEVMRHGAQQARAHDAAFVLRLRHKIAQEDIKTIAVSETEISATGQFSSRIKVANDAHWRRVVGLASVALVGVLAWQGYRFAAPETQGNDAAQLVQVQPRAGVSAPAVALPVLQASTGGTELMLRDPRLDAMLAAHRQFGGNSALQMPSGFLRNATFEEGKR